MGPRGNLVHASVGPIAAADYRSADQSKSGGPVRDQRQGTSQPPGLVGCFHSGAWILLWLVSLSTLEIPRALAPIQVQNHADCCASDGGVDRQEEHCEPQRTGFAKEYRVMDGLIVVVAAASVLLDSGSPSGDGE